LYIKAIFFTDKFEGIGNQKQNEIVLLTKAREM